MSRIYFYARFFFPEKNPFERFDKLHPNFSRFSLVDEFLAPRSLLDHAVDIFGIQRMT